MVRTEEDFVLHIGSADLAFSYSHWLHDDLGLVVCRTQQTLLMGIIKAGTD